MTAQQFVAHLAASRIYLSAKNGKLTIDAPKSQITPKLKAELVARKPELLALLVPKICLRCDRLMQRIEFGYFACACGYQVVEPRSGFWVSGSI